MSAEKVCAKCKQSFPRTSEFFGKESKSGDGLRSRCKACTKEDKAESYKKNLKSRKDYIERNKEQIAAYKKQYRQDHAEHISEYNKAYCSQYYRDNRESMLKKQMEHHYANYVDQTNYRNKRRLIYSDQFVEDITHDMFWECYGFFDGCDAYTGEPLDKPVMDHIVPISDGGHHARFNIVLCARSTNARKSTLDMETWYRSQDFFSEDRLNRIHEYQRLMKEKINWKE